MCVVPKMRGLTLGHVKAALAAAGGPVAHRDGPDPGRRAARTGERPGIRHLALAVDDIDAVVAGLRARGTELIGEVERYRDIFRLRYVRGPEGIIIELAERIG